jgi:cell division protein FtsB
MSQQPETERISKADLARLRQDNARLRAENDALRPLISQLGHELAALRRKARDGQKDADEHG